MSLQNINNANITIKEYHGQRVVTFKDIDAVHGRPDGTAKRNFNANKERFIEGEDYFVRNSYEASHEYGVVAPNGLTLLTESGYLMLVRSFTDDLAWKVQKQLVNGYFRARILLAKWARFQQNIQRSLCAARRRGRACASISDWRTRESVWNRPARQKPISQQFQNLELSRRISG